MLNLAVVIALFISYLSVLIPPDKYWIPALFGMAFPFLVAANIVFVVFWLLIKPQYSLISIFAILIGWSMISRYVQFGAKTTESEGVKVLSYNVQHFTGNDKLSEKEIAIEILTFLNAENSDIICLQEARLRKNQIFNLPDAVKKLSSIRHYQFARSSTTFGSVTLTRFPIINMGEIRFNKTRNMSIYTDMLIGTDTVRVFNVHLQSYLIDPGKYSVIESPGVDQEKDLKEIREMGLKFRKAFQMRAEQVREIRRHINESPYTVIVCGDFNDTPISYAYQKLRGNLKDAFVSSGSGISHTYIGKLPSFRIDNVFHSKEFESFNFQTHGFRMSDHLPVSCTLVKKSGN